MEARIVHGAQLSSLRVAAFACALLMPGCHRDHGNGGGIDAFGARTAEDGAVQASVNGTIVTDRLATSTQETRQAAPGSRFVVLDVTARNTDRQPQVFSEGKLVNVSESRERAFATPVSMLADEFLTLQVLKPLSRVRGKIAWEVPDDLAGVLYWVPGNGGQRILLHVTAPADAVATSANAQVDAPHAPTPAVSTAAPKVGAGNAPSPPVRLDTPAAATLPSTTTVHADTRAAPVTPPADAAAPGHNDHARTLACDALVSRNDPAEKARYLGFFSRSCAGYAMPSAWTSNDVASATPAVAPATGPRWPPRPGPAFDCSQAYTRAEHLVCEDAVLSLMDWELNRAYARAIDGARDPVSLQRTQEDWRRHVRDACDNVPCVQNAYDRRTTELEAMAKRP